MSTITIQKATVADKNIIDQIVNIHLATFKGFFLTFMGKGFLKQMYASYVKHSNSDILIAVDGEHVLGFLAYSEQMSSLYKYMICHRLIPFAWYSLGAFLRKPKVFMRLIRAFLKPSESHRNERYVELASIGVHPSAKSNGIGSQLIDALKSEVDFQVFAYITLETDAVNNEAANHFYVKNDFSITREFETHEGRKMYEYRYKGDKHAPKTKASLHTERCQKSE